MYLWNRYNVYLNMILISNPTGFVQLQGNIKAQNKTVITRPSLPEKNVKNQREIEEEVNEKAAEREKMKKNRQTMQNCVPEVSLVLDIITLMKKCLRAHTHTRLE